MIDLFINRGSDLDFRLTWKDALGAPLDLGESTVTAFEPHPLLAEMLSLSITDAPAGVITGRIEWSDDFPTGRYMTFRVRISANGTDTSTQIIRVVVE